MKKSTIVISSAVVLVLGVVGASLIFVKISANKADNDTIKPVISTPKQDGESSKSGDEVTLVNEGLKLTVPEGLEFKNETNEWESLESDPSTIIKSDYFSLTSGKFNLSIVTNPDGLGGGDACIEQNNEFRAKCKVIASSNLMIFNEDKIINLWEEVSSYGTTYSLKIASLSEKDSVEGRAFGTYMFESRSDQNNRNLISITKIDESKITAEDLNSNDMKQIISVLQSLHY